jgi:hypothetical protein
MEPDRKRRLHCLTEPTQSDTECLGLNESRVLGRAVKLVAQDAPT